MQGFNLGGLFNNFLGGVGEALVAAFMDNLSSDLNVIIRASKTQTQDDILRIQLKVHNIDQLVRADGDPSLMTQNPTVSVCLCGA